MNELFPYPDKFTPDQKLLALSWKQPFAELMLYGKIETRTWNTNYRGWVLICCSKNPYDYLTIQQIAGNKQFKRILEKIPFDILQTRKEYLGNAIAVGYLSECRPMQLQDEDKCFVLYHSNLYCHIYNSIFPIEPFSWKGKQGWTKVAQDIKSKILTR